MATKKAKAKTKVKAGNTQEEAANRRMVFIEAYLTNGGNASQAAVAAGFSEKTAGAAGSRLLKHVEVSTQLQQRRAKLAEKYELTTESVIRSLAQAVHFDPRKMFNTDGTLKPIHELDDDTAAALAGFEVTEEKGSGNERGKVVGFTKKVKWLDKNTAREQAMKHLGLYLEDNKQKSPLEGISRDALKAVVERLSAKGR